MEFEHAIGSTGFVTKVDKFEDKIPEYDSRSGNHFWIIVGSWKIDPERWISGTPGLLDHENLVSIAGPACFYCERLYSKVLNMKRCKGHG